MPILLLVAFVFFIAFTVWNEISADDNIGATNESLESEADVTAAINNFNLSFVIVAVFYVIVMITLAALVRAHPAFLPVGILIWVFVIVLSSQISNLFYDFYNSEEMAGAATQYNMITFIMDKMPYFFLFAGLILMIAMYSSSRVQGGE